MPTDFAGVIGFIMQCAIAAGGGGAVVALIQVLGRRREVGATAQNLGATAQATVIDNVTSENARLSVKIGDLEDENTKVETQMRDVTRLLWSFESWANRVYDLLDEEQKVKVGHPPQVTRG